MPKKDSRSFSDKFWNDKDGNIVVWQKPNLFLWGWFICFLLTFFLPNGQLLDIVNMVGRISILVWAALELFLGVNYFRRLLGLLVLLLPLIIII